ncbi:hypothetical protein VTO73DRAFT_10430 [Trametes versicolor]
MSVDGTQTTDILLEDQCSRVTTYLGSLPASQAVVNDIEQLRKSIDEINSLFNEVMCTLQTFDHEHFQSPTATGVELAPRWAEFRTLFNEQVDNSRESAAAASRIMHLYAGAVLGKIKETNCNVQALEVEKHTVVAKDVYGGFRKIAQDIKDFKHKVELTINLKNISGPLSQDMTSVFNKIEDLKQKVENIPDEVPYKEYSYLEMAASLVPRAAKILGMLSPTTTIQAQAVVSVPVKGVVVTQAQIDLAQGSTLRHIANVAQRIEAIANIWHHLRIDMLSLETDLRLCSGNANVANSTFLVSKIEASRAVCELLCKCLDLYVL